MTSQPRSKKNRLWRSEDGRSIVEVLTVVAISSLLTAVAVPQMIGARRMMRSNGLARQIAAQLRFTRQQAMSQRQAFTFQYDDSTKTITILDHNNTTAGCILTGQQVLTAPGYPNTACTTTALTVPLAVAGLTASEISYGIPNGISGSTTLDDGTTITNLSGTVVNITFQSNGTVTDGSGNYVSPTMFFYNTQVPTQTATGISVLGAAGRVKVWRYSSSASKYAE